MPLQNKYDFPDDEHHLLLLVSRGDENAFTALVSLYHNKVFSHALTFVKSYETAEEITQDIFMKVWINRAKLPGIQNFKNYLFILGRNQLISAIRKKVMDTLPVEPEDIPENYGPDRQLENKEMQRILQEGIEKLPPQQKAVFTLSRLEGMSHEEIGQELGISKHTVRWHIVLALNSLRRHLHEYRQLIPLLVALLAVLYTLL